MGERPKEEDLKWVPVTRPCVGKEGCRISLLSNHFNVRFTGTDAVFYHYSVVIKYEDDKIVETKGIRRKVMEKLVQMYSSELARKDFAYDGENSFFTVGPLPQDIFEFMVVLEEVSSRVTGSPVNRSPGEVGDKKRQKQVQQTTTFKVSLTFAAKIPLNSIAMSLRGINTPYTQDALRVLDIILMQQHANSGCLLVGQSYFNGDPKSFVDLGGGVTGCRGFHSSFCTTLNGLSLNMDVTTTMIMKPGPVIDFLMENQSVREASMIDWMKAKRMLKNMRIKTKHNKMEFKIFGISDLPCNEQRFPMKVREDGESQTIDVTVCEYYQKKHQIKVSWSAKFPSLDVGKPNCPNYLPLELCDLISLQHYTKALSSQQRANLVESSRQKPKDRTKTITEAIRSNQYDENPLLKACGIQIEKQLNRFDGRVLTAPTLLLGDGEEFVPNCGRWNFNNKKLINPVRIERWAICNFSARVDMSHVSREIINCGRNKGIHIERPFTLVEEDRQWLKAGPIIRVDKMFEKIRAKLPGSPQFLLCILPDKKNSEIYGPWKKKNLHEMGIMTQCISPGKHNDQYFTNVLLKINAKLGGINSSVSVEYKQSIPIIHENPTLILGLNVSHGSLGRSDLPAITTVVGSRHWPSISKYRASVRTQSTKLEMIDQLYKPTADGKDDNGMIREILIDFYQTSGGRKPTQIIIFRDGVNETQFGQVLNIELNQIIKAYEHLGDGALPKFTLIIAQKNHHAVLFQADSPDNVPPGTIVDTKVVHPKNYDFFMCAHNGMIGTSRPIHYHVLVDEIGFPVDDLQKLVHSLSYVYQRSTTATSAVAPICYAHLAAQQMSQFMKFENLSDTSSGSDAIVAVPDLPRLHKNVCNSMFFC